MFWWNKAYDILYQSLLLKNVQINAINIPLPSKWFFPQILFSCIQAYALVTS
jgi:hypothetical protein